MNEEEFKQYCEKVEEKFNVAFDKLPAKTKKQVSQKRIYPGVLNLDGTITELYVDDLGKAVACINDSEVLNTQNLNGLLTLVETPEAMYLVPSLRNRCKGFVKAGGIKELPKLKEDFDLFIPRYNVEEATIKFFKEEVKNVRKITKLEEDVFLITADNSIVVVINGYDLHKLEGVSDKETVVEEYNTSYC